MRFAGTTGMSGIGASTHRTIVALERSSTPNSPSNLRNPSFSLLARRLLSTPVFRAIAVTMGLLFTAQGCIIPQDETFLDPLPPRKNRPPRIVPENIIGPTQVGSDPDVCGDYTYSVAVEDADVDDIIRWAFFIDYSPTTPNVQRTGFIIPNGTTVRAGATITFNSSTSRLFTSGNHQLDVVVGDTDFDSDTRVPAPHSQGVDGGPGDPGYTDTYTWFVETIPGACP